MADISALTNALGTNLGSSISNISNIDPTQGVTEKLYLKQSKDILDAQKNMALEEVYLKGQSADYQKAQSDAYLEKQKKTYDDNQEKTQKLESQQNWEYPEFHPTQTNLQEMATIFSLVGIVGTMLGGGGRNAGMNALSSMTGMMEGWKKGEKDRYLQEKSIFDTNLKVMEQKNNALQKRIEQLAKDYTRNREVTKDEYAVLLAENPYLKKVDAIAGVKGVITAAAEANKSMLSLLEFREKQRANAEARALKAGKSAADRYGFGDIVAAASNEAAAAIKMIMGLPVESTSGIFGGRTTTSLFTAPVDVMANKITSETAQRYNVESGKLAYSLAQLMSGGRAVRVNDVAQMNSILSIKEGDTLETVATKVAEARQIAERTMEVRARSSSTDPGLREVFKENLATVQQVVPFTVDDINKFVINRDKSTTLIDALSNKYVEPQKYNDPEKEARYQKWKKENPQ